MANEPQITIYGGVTRDPEIRFTQSGAAVINFDVAVTPRSHDRQTNAWKDGQTEYFRCTAWKTMAENIAESYRKGTQVFVNGRFKTGSYEKNGVTRTTLEIDVDETGPTMKFQKTQVMKAAPGGGGQQSGGGFGASSSGGGGFGSSQRSGGFGSGAPATGGEEPPF